MNCVIAHQWNHVRRLIITRPDYGLIWVKKIWWRYNNIESPLSGGELSGLGVQLRLSWVFTVQTRWNLTQRNWRLLLPTNQNTPSLMLPDAQEIFLSWDSLQLKNPRWEEISDAVPLTGLASRTGCLLITKIIRTKHFIIVISLDWDVFSVFTGTALVDMLHGTVHVT